MRWRPRQPFRGKQVHLTDLMGTELYDRDGTDVVDNGLLIDLAPWRFNVFELRSSWPGRRKAAFRRCEA